MAKKKQQQVKNDNTVLWIIITLIVLAISIVAFLRLGLVGIILSNILAFLLGDLYWLSLISFFTIGAYTIYKNRKSKPEIKVIVGIVLINLAALLLLATLNPTGIVDFATFGSYAKECGEKLLASTAQFFGAGVIGNAIYALVYLMFDRIGTYVIIVLMFIIVMLLIVPIDVYRKFFFEAQENFKESKQRKALEKQARQLANEKEVPISPSFQNIEVDDSPVVSVDSKPKSSIFIDVDKPSQDRPKTELKTPVDDKPKVLQAKTNNGPYILPPLSTLENITSKSSNVNRTSANIKGQKVIEILQNFGIEAELVNTHIGPSVTKFEIKPDSSVKVSKIQAISDNIKMELAAKDIRIEAPIPGRSAVGIEIPNVEPTMVRMYELIKNLPGDKKNKPLLFALGKDLLGKNIYCELDKMPHLLIAGATGSGKSVCINTIISSFLMNTYPEDIRLVLIDPKKVEFTPYHDIPHLMWPVITDATMASNMLKKIVVIMEERYEAFADAGVRNIKGFNDLVVSHNANLKDEESPMTKMPYIVVIIDELADLMAIAGKEVELSIQRITQLARASGIHLIVATQRPSTDVITGIIKSNIPSRISFAVASSIDSRTILDQTGAERLLGNGDMLYAPQGENSPIRIQGVYVTDQEIKKLTDYVKKQQQPVYDDTYFEFLNINNNASGSAMAQDKSDSLMDDVIEYVVDVQKASTSLLQRRFGIGYNRAARIIEMLEERGIIGPAQGSKPREVYQKKENSEDE